MSGFEMARLLDIDAGDHYGRWLVLGPTESGRPGGRHYECLCDPEVGGCGSRKFVLGRSLASGESRSCGCYKREVARKRATKHGLGGHELHSVHRGMIDRCSNPNSLSWPRYGGRGITICDRWRGPSGLENFVADMHPRPDGAVLHRRDNNAGYSPENCEWVQQSEHIKQHALDRTKASERAQTLSMELRQLRTLVAGGLLPSTIHEDERGWIRDVTNEHWDAATRVVTYEGKVRGNHYHKKTLQLTLVTVGRLRIVTEMDEMRREFVLKAGEMMISPPGERHAWKALEDTHCLVFTRGPRSGPDYESDTERLEEPLIA